MKITRMRKAVAATSAAALAIMGLTLAAAPAAYADGVNGEVRGFVWPGGDGSPNWEGTYRMPDGSEAWCASIWSPEPIYADSYGSPVPLTKNDGSPLSGQEMTTLAYVVSSASDVVINKTGHTADEYAAAASVIIHNMTNSTPSNYDPAWPLGHFDANDDPLGTGQQTTGVHAIYDTLLAEAAQYGGEWELAWAPAPDNVQIGDVVDLTGTLQTLGGTPVPQKDIYITASGTDIANTTVTTDAAGNFTFSSTVTAEDVVVTADRIAPASTVMMREAESWQGSERPQNMILIDDASITAQVQVAAQPVPVEPSLGTSAVDQADGDRIIDWAGGTVIDTITYENLTPGTEYTLDGELINKATGEGTGITGTATFTPTEASGTAEVSFTIPEGFDGTTLVAFESLYDTDGRLVATHEDINDEAQTVTVNDKPTVPAATGSNSSGTLAVTGGEPALPLILTGLGLIAAAIVIGAVRRARARS